MSHIAAVITVSNDAAVDNDDMLAMLIEMFVVLTVGAVTLSLWVHRCVAFTSTRQFPRTFPDTWTRFLHLMLDNKTVTIFLSFQSIEIGTTAQL